MNRTNYMRAVLVAYVLVGVAAGCLAQLLRHRTPAGTVGLCAALVQVLLVFKWYRADSEERQVSRGVLLNIAIIGLTVVALPYYFFRSRGFREGLTATLVAIVVAGLGWGGEYAAALGTYKILR